MIKAKGIVKHYRQGFWMRSVKALNEVTLNVHSGDLYGFIGPNGAGKSTTIKTILGLVNFEKGELELFGQKQLSLKNRLRMGYMPEQPYFNDSLSGWEIVSYAASLCKLQGSAREKAIENAFEIVNAGEWVHRPLRQYSKGMQQRIGLAQAIVHQPELLILDEPMSGLDPLGRKELRDAMLKLHAQGTTLFFSSHVLSDVEQLCNRVGMIVQGEIRLEGQLNELLSQDSSQCRFRVNSDQQLQFPGIHLDSSRTWVLQDASQAKSLQEFLGQQNLTITFWGNTKVSLEELLGKELAR